MTTPIPDEVREAAHAHLASLGFYGADEPDSEFYDSMVDALAPIFAAHFAKERDNLQAKYDKLVADLEVSAWADVSGAADRLRAEGWDDCLEAVMEAANEVGISVLPAPRNPFLTPKGTDK